MMQAGDQLKFQVKTESDNSWITPPVRTLTKLIPKQTRRDMYDKSETTYKKLLMRRIQIWWDCFCVIHFLPLFQNNFSNNVRTKIVPVKPDLPRRILLCRGLRFFRGASVCTDLFLVFQGSQAGVRALDNIVFARTSDTYVGST